MFSKELESLIQATLEDGVLEENEKAALVKRAEREGVDIAELEIYINSLLQKRARELENEKNAVRKQAEKDKKEAFGRKCPNCGAQVPPLTLKCECGYEFTKKEAVSSVQILSEKIDKLLSKGYKSEPDSDAYKAEVKQRYQQVKEAINLFPVPNTKEDIIEFLALSVPNARKKGGIWGTKSGRCFVVGAILLVIVIIFVLSTGESDFWAEADRGNTHYAIASFMFGSCGCFAFMVFYKVTSSITPVFIHNDAADAWRAKFDQVLMKGRSLRGDAEFTRQLDYYENMLNK